MKKTILIVLLCLSGTILNAQEVDSPDNEEGVSKIGYSISALFGKGKLVGDGIVKTNVDIAGFNFKLEYDFMPSLNVHAGFGVYQLDTNLAIAGENAYFEQSQLYIPAGVTWKPDFNSDLRIKLIDFTLALDVYGKTISKQRLQTLEGSVITKNYSWNFGVNTSVAINFNLAKHSTLSAGLDSFQDISYNKKNNTKQKIQQGSLFSLKYQLRF